MKKIYISEVQVNRIKHIFDNNIEIASFLAIKV
jgi:hypothetical protein